MKWKGRKLLPLPVMAWRCFWYPFIIIAKVVLCTFVCLGFGLDSARQVWREVS